MENTQAIAVKVGEPILERKPIVTEEDYRKLEQVQQFFKEYSPNVISSIDSKGYHCGTFKGFGFDADGYLIIECDVESLSLV